MTQYAAVLLDPAVVQFELPASSDEALPGIPWGAVDAFPTPAYWTYQVLARRVSGQTIRYRLGDTLAEEVAACLLGGHGIPASVGVAAFHYLKSARLLEGTPSEASISAALAKPIEVDGRSVRYRFVRQKSRYVSAALARLAADVPPLDSGRALRDWLLDIPGVGYKTASWIARNWLDADDIAILDIHILRAGALAGFFARGLTVQRDYLELEEQFLRFSRAIGVRASELDAVMWLEMMSSPATIRRLLHLGRSPVTGTRAGAGADIRDTDPRQASLLD
ncbi:8-oxoguanine DNA glycosylase [Paraburkholderia caledonica]|uniref:Thermostable 8-oxoguanine DNA glycosylase n=1 Tax=Paraburkholderia caledonica TaxID=134536 RepID=A0AB73II19_9BURK|nr:thermostable 8-oxoguanine DNA glycosylase [Paraburkholderia caledonica]